MENHRTYSASITFRFDSDNIENLQKEAYNRGISLTSLTNQIVKEFFEWHIFEPKIGFVPILKPVVEELFAKMSKEQISQIAANTGKEEFKNALHFMKGKLDLDSFLSWFEARMKNSSMQVSHTFDLPTMTHTHVVKHDINENSNKRIIKQVNSHLKPLLWNFFGGLIICYDPFDTISMILLKRAVAIVVVVAILFFLF